MNDDMPQLLKPLEERLERQRAFGHLQWAREEVMRLGARLMAVLKEVHDKKSYRFEYESFADYCQKEWKITSARAYQIIQGENFRALLMEQGVDTDDLRSGHLRELSAVTPAQAAEVIKKVRKTGKVTESSIREAISPKSKKDKPNREKKIAEALRDEIKSHGPITASSIAEAAKRIANLI